MVVNGPPKAPLAYANLRAETVADTNRGRMRGWVILALAALVVFAVLAWPDYVAVLVLSIIAAVVAAFFVQATQNALSDAERDPSSEGVPPRDAATGELD